MHRPAVTQQGRQAVGGRRPRMVTSSGFPSVTYNIVYDFNNTEGNDSTTNPFVRGVAPLRPVFNDNLNNNDEYRALRREIVRLEVLVYQKYQVRTGPLGPVQLVTYGRTGGGYGPVPLPAYFEEIANINAFLTMRRENIAELNRLNAEMARIVEANEYDNVLVSIPQMARFVAWRTGYGDTLIAANEGRQRDFPFERGPQHVIIDYETAFLMGEETTDVTGIDTDANREWFPVVLNSTRGVDYLGQSLTSSMAMGCVDHFYAYIQPRLVALLRAEGRVIRDDQFLAAEDIIAVPYNTWVAAIIAAYEIQILTQDTLDQVRQLATRMTNFFVLLLNRNLNVRDAQGRPTEDISTVALARELKRIYTNVTYMGHTMTPLYKRDMNQFAICGIGFMAGYIYRGNNAAIREAQDAIFLPQRGETYSIEDFTERVLRPNARLMSIALDAEYNSFGVLDRSRVVRVRVERNVITIPEVNPMAVGRHTPQLGYIENGYQQYHKYFGHNRYEMGYTDEQRNMWKDNSNSGNLCGITCMLYNEHVYPVVTSLITEEEFIGQIALTLGLYNDERLNMISNYTLKDVIYVVCRWVGFRTDLYERIVVHKSGKKIEAKYFAYEIETDTISVYDKEPVYEGDRVMTIRIYQNEGHLFNVWNEAHYKYIINKFRTPPIISSTETTCLFNELRMYNYKKHILDNPHKIMDLRDMWLKDEITVHAHIPRELINELDVKHPSQEALNRFRQLTGRNLRDKEAGKLARKAYDSPVICGYDLETVMRDRTYAYGFTLAGNHGMGMQTRHILGTCGSDNLETGEAILFMHLIYEIAKVVHQCGEDGVAWFCAEHEIEIEKYTGKRYYPQTIVTAHNGGCFDTVLFRNVFCRDKLGFCNLLKKWRHHTFNGFRFQCNQDIIAGGKMKVFIVDVQGPKGDFSISFVDSLNLLNCKLADAAKMYDLTIQDNTKGVYPYALYDYVINNGNNHIEWTRQELIDTVFPDYVRKDVDRFLAADNRTSVNLSDLFKEYCEQDVRIMMSALYKAHELFHSIVLPDANGINILGPEGGVVISETKRGKKKLIKPNFMTEVTLPGFAKKIAKSVVLTKGTVDYKTIANDYCKVWTGGLTYCKTVSQFVSDKIREIATNDFFYLDPRKTDLIDLFVRNGYDVNKPKLTYRRDNVPEIVKQLKEQLNEIGSYLVLVDANSLYPAAMYSLMSMGGFPIGHEGVIRDADHCQELYQNNKRWIAYFRVRWTEKAINLYARRELPMHQLIITSNEGNRHLRPGDNRCQSLGMTDIEYRSINETDTGLFRLEFINGIYWENSTNNLSLLMRNLYNERLRLKSIGSPAEKCTKLVMNATYGAMLEAVHYVISKYLDSREDETEEDVQTMDNVTLAPITRKRKVACASQYTSDEINHGKVSDYDRLGEFYRSERLSLKKILDYPGYSYIASFILGAAKRNMNKLFYRMDWDVKYTDTDSAFMENQVFQKLMREDDPNNKMMGNDLGMFKSDFDDKFPEATKLCDVGITSVSGVFLAKKLYCNVLLGVVCDAMIERKKEIEKVNPNVQYKDCILPEDECYITCKFKTAGKGVVHNAIPYTTYEALVDDAVVLKQDRAGILAQVFVKDGGVKTDGGIHITRQDDPHRRLMERTIKNQNAIERDRELLRVNKERKILMLEPLPAPQRIVIEQGVLPKYGPKPKPTMLTLNIMK